MFKKIFFACCVLSACSYFIANGSENRKELDAQIQKDAEDVLDENIAEMVAESNYRKNKIDTKNPEKRAADVRACTPSKNTKKDTADKR